MTTWPPSSSSASSTRPSSTAAQAAKKAGKTAEQAAAELKLPEKFKDYDIGRAKENVEAIYADLP